MSNWLKPLPFVWLVACLVACLPAGGLAAETRKPNIVLILADDLGWTDVGYNGSSFFETPRIDQLVRDGMMFTSGYASAAKCVPARACLLSGQYTPRHNVYTVGSTARVPQALMRMIPVTNTSGLPPRNVTLAEVLKTAGYATGIFGKWHLAGKDGVEPSEQGFETVMDQDYPGSGIREDPKGIFEITRAACEFIEGNRVGPFFAYVSHHAIHSGWQARGETLKHFQSRPRGDEPATPLYAACAADLDTSVGILLDKLADLGLATNTLVVFTSDHGRVPSLPQEPLRGGKGSYYEGGIRVPFIVQWPGVVVPGSTCNEPVTHTDLFPTFLEAAAAPTPAAKQLDGESLLPLLQSTSPLRRAALFWHYPRYLNGPVHRGRDPVFRTRPVSAIRKGDWKLLLYHEEWQLDGGLTKVNSNNAVELYNLAEDLGERHNVALDNRQKRDELVDDLLAWFKSTAALLPTQSNLSYDPSTEQPANKKR